METAPLPQKGTEPPILAHVYCGQTAGWIKTPLSTEVDLGAGHFVLDGSLAIGKRGTATPSSFRPCILWPRSPISATAELLLHNSRQRVLLAYTLFHSKLPLQDFNWGIWIPSNSIWFLGPTRIDNPNGISILDRFSCFRTAQS